VTGAELWKRLPFELTFSPCQYELSASPSLSDNVPRPLTDVALCPSLTPPSNPTTPAGFTGPTGMDGVNGTNGATGATGPTGPMGATGATGVRGPPTRHTHMHMLSAYALGA
jgi:hypothetical protein